MKRNILRFVFFIFLSLGMGSYLFAQVGIGNLNPNADALLDVGTDTSTAGLRLPRVALTGTANVAPLSAHVQGMMVYNTATTGDVLPGQYYNDGSKWILLAGDGWKLTGNAGTTAGTNFLGTTDNQNLILKTNSNENMRIVSNGQVAINETSPLAGDRFTVTGASDEFTIVGLSSGNNGVGIFGENTDEGIGVFGSSNIGFGVLGLSNTIGVYGASDDIGTIGLTLNGYGIYGYTENAGAIAGRMRNLNPTGVSMVVTGQAQPYLAYMGGAATFSGTNGLFSIGASDGLLVAGNSLTPFSIIGEISGITSIGEDIGLIALANNNNGTGVIGVGNNNTSNTLPNGSGGAFTGSRAGVYAISTVENLNLSSTGVIGAGNNESPITLQSGSGGAFTGRRVGIAGFATDTSNTSFGVYGEYSGGDIDGIGVYGIANPNPGWGYGIYGIGGNSGVYGITYANNSTSYGVYGSAPNATYGVFAAGDLGATGTKTFAIDYPEDPANKILKHFSIESDEVLNIYRGTAIFNTDGSTSITLPAYYQSVNKNATYQLTPIGASMPNMYIENEINNNSTFTIAGGIPGKKVSWMVTAERNDPYLQQNPEKRENIIDKGNDRGKYLTPKLYGKPVEKGIHFTKPPETKEVRGKEMKTKKMKTKEIKTKEVETKEVKTKYITPRKKKIDKLEKN